MRNFEFLSTAEARGKVFGIWFFNRTPAYKIRQRLIIRSAIEAFGRSRVNVDEGYFVCADLSLIAISRRTLTLASSNIVQTACPDISNAYDLALFLEDKIAGCADLMGHLLQSSKELPIK